MPTANRTFSTARGQAGSVARRQSLKKRVVGQASRGRTPEPKQRGEFKRSTLKARGSSIGPKPTPDGHPHGKNYATTVPHMGQVHRSPTRSPR